jgi:hypothetical protein
MLILIKILRSVIITGLSDEEDLLRVHTSELVELVFEPRSVGF